MNTHESYREQQQLTDPQRTASWWQIFGPNFPYQQFGLGALIPIGLFYTFQRFDQAITGALLGTGWGLGVLVITYWRSRRGEKSRIGT